MEGRDVFAVGHGAEIINLTASILMAVAMIPYGKRLMEAREF